MSGRLILRLILFALPLGLKDVELALALGDALRVPLPAASVVRDHLLAALARGRERLDWSGLATIALESNLLDLRLARGEVSDSRSAIERIAKNVAFVDRLTLMIEPITNPRWTECRASSLVLCGPALTL